MIKRALFILIALIPFCVKAQLAVGEWKIYTVFANEITKMLETPQKLYYLSEGCLFSYDKETDETYKYASVNKLNDNEITNIYYNKTNKYLFIAYESGNIDLLYDDGKVINMSDIKDATLTTSKGINDVAFNNNRIYVATVFGLVVFDDQKHEVIESGIYDKNIVCLDVVGDNIVLCYNFGIYASSINKKHNLFDSFTKITGGNAFTIKSVNDSKALIRVYDGTKYLMWLMTFDFANNIYTSRLDLAYNNSQVIYDIKETIFSYNSESIAFIDGEGNITTTSLPEELQGKTIAMWDGLNSVWAGNGNGLANYDISGETLSVLKDNFIPESITVKNVIFLHRGNSGKIYMSNTGGSKHFNYDAYVPSQICTINNGEIENVVPTTFIKSNTKNPGSTKLYDTYQVVEDPTDPESYYVGTYWEGIYKVTNRETVKKYDWDNSTITKINGFSCHVPALAFDRDNNLWALQYINSGNPVLNMITAANLKKENTTIDDWNGIVLGDFIGDKDGRILICKKSNMILLCDGTYDSRLVAYDTKGTYENVSDDNYVIWDKFLDQDGKYVDPTYITCLAEDQNGKVWVGTREGVFEITNPSNATNSSMTINHIKVPRNDGTQLADYLLDGEFVTAISVDSSNRKWIGTSTSGIYLVSESGDEVLEHFTSENSSLPSNKVYSVICDPTGNSVFMGTDVGLIEYSSTSSPAAEDYSEVYAYPNPVRPDYTGWITIKGLMDNSLVKIADAAGNVFYTTQSEGGMVTWDGCNASGERVKTGVYYVFASQNNDGSNSSGAVTKILVVN